MAAWAVAANSESNNRDLSFDRHKREQAFQPGHGMVNRSTTAQSTVAMRRRGPPVMVTLAAMAAVAALSTQAVARQARTAPPVEATAPREAGDPIMAIVSIKSQKVTFYDADGWILRAPVSTGITGRETPAGVFALIEKDKDHHSSLYDDAWMPNMQRITWNGVARSRRLSRALGTRLTGRGVGRLCCGYCHQRGHGRERHNGGRPPLPDRLDGLRRREWICHVSARRL